MVKFIGITTAGKFQDFKGPLLLFKDRGNPDLCARIFIKIPDGKLMHDPVGMSLVIFS